MICVLLVVCIHDLSSIYRVPVLMEKQGMVELLEMVCVL
jgi:CTP synthase (UTP-ammonia lyase)